VVANVPLLLFAVQPSSRSEEATATTFDCCAHRVTGGFDDIYEPPFSFIFFLAEEIMFLLQREHE
jgi:hypothetical protein